MDISLAICDDENTEREYLQQLITDWAKSRNIRLKLLLYPSAEAFLFAYRDIPVDIALLDIRMGDMDGISLAKCLRQEDDRVQIVFVTGLPDFIAEGYEVAALHYLMKPVSNKKMADVLDRAVKRLSTEEVMVSLPLKDVKQRLPISSIYYAEAFSHDILLHTTNGDLSMKIALTELERELGESFSRCHRSFLANIRHVRKITKNSLEMDNAMEACSKLPKEKRFIRVYMDIKGENLYISVTNSSPGKPEKSGVFFVTSKAGSHGFGLLRMEAIIRKYNGIQKTNGEADAFTAEILLPI